MRLLQIDPNDSETTALDFHPMVTVVTGLTPSGREIVMRVARSLATAQDPGHHGLIEAHGVLLDLNRNTLELLDLQGDVDVLVNENDLPPGPVPSDESGSESGPRTHDEVDVFIRDAPIGLDEDLDLARRRQADAREALGILQEASDKAQSEFDRVLAALKLAEAELAAAREASGPILRLVGSEGDGAGGEGPAEPMIDVHEMRRMHEELTTRITAGEERIATIGRGLEELSAIDTRPLTVLLEAVKNPQPIEYVPSERAHELADEVVDIERKVAELEKELDKRGLASGTALKQVEVARLELVAAESSMTRPEASPEDIAELERVHEEVLELQGKKRAGKKLEQAAAQQQEILDRIGFPTWSAYVMGAGLMAIDHTVEQRVEKARTDLEAAESHWSSVVQEIEANPAHRSLLDRLEEVYIEAFDLLGGAEPDDLEGALRALQVPKREVTTAELIDALAYQLELVGLQLPAGAGADLTVMAAEAFIEEAQAVDGRIAELRDERATCEAELAVARGKLAELPDLPELPELPELPDLPEPSEPFEPAGQDSRTVDGVPVGDDPWGAFDEPDPGGAAQPPAQTGFDAFDPDDPFGLGNLSEEPRDPIELDAGPELDLDAIPDGDGVGVFGGPDLAETGDAPAGDASTGGGADLTDLERAVEVAREEVEEYTEWLESRQALVDAALTVETIATSRLFTLADELMDELADGSLDSGSMDVRGNGRSVSAGTPLPDDVEAYLSERVEAQRHLSYAGSVPLVLDDTLRPLDAGDVRRVLDHLQEASDTVQVIYLTDDTEIAGWAEAVGFQRAAVVPAPVGFG